MLAREEAGFDRTLRTGLGLLEEALATAAATDEAVLAGDVAFRLHDTHGFPIELTEELADEAGVTVDRAGFDAAMAEQRARARLAARTPAAADEDAYRTLLEAEGPTGVRRARPGRATPPPARVIGVLAGAEPGTAEIFLDRTPFYAEGGGQVGDMGTIVTETGRAEVYDTVPALPGLTAHRARVDGGDLRRPGRAGRHRRTAPRGTCVATTPGPTSSTPPCARCWATTSASRGRLVAPDRLRFDFSHHAAPTAEELAAVSELANPDVVTDEAVVTTEATRKEAEAMGALAFFGDKYGDVVRVVRAGPPLARVLRRAPTSHSLGTRSVRSASSRRGRSARTPAGSRR